eukprot:g34522.t1
MDTAGIEYYLAEKHPSCDRRIKNGTLYLVYITMSKVYDDYVSRYFDFILPEIARKLISGETIRFVPQCKRRRGQEQLRLAFQSVTVRSGNAKRAIHLPIMLSTPSTKERSTRAEVELAGQDHTWFYQSQMLRDYRQQRASWVAVCIILMRLISARVSFPPSRNNCSCVPLFCSCAHRTPVYNPVKQMQLRIPELRQWWQKIASFLERPFLISEWKALVTPPLRSDWTRLTAQMNIENRATGYNAS